MIPFMGDVDVILIEQGIFVDIPFWLYSLVIKWCPLHVLNVHVNGNECTTDR